jgi:hypothetical protein
MSTASAESLQQEIQNAGQDLGEAMDKVLPWRESIIPIAILRILGSYEWSAPIIMKDTTERDQPTESIYTRAWLVRDCAKREGDSIVALLSDSVAIDLSTPVQDIYRREDSKIVAAYSKNGELKLDEDLGAPQEATLNHIQALGGWVAEIAEATSHKKLIDTVPLIAQEIR